MFLRDCWYAAGFSDDFSQSLAARTFLGEAVVIYRTEAGAPVALEDRCAHRRLPLSMGRLEGDGIQCAYHGLVYDRSGACVRIPGQASVPEGARVRSYPVLDRHTYLWIWMGDPEHADPALIPDYGAIDEAGERTSRIRLHLGCNYLLTVDNLLDLSHLAYVHATTTGGPALAEEATVKTVRQGDSVLIKRWQRDIDPSPTFKQFGGYQGRVNLWQVSEYRAPCYIRVSYGSCDAAVPVHEDDDIWSHGAWGFKVLHGLMPETERTTHQFRTVTIHASQADSEVIAEFRRQCDQIINEDREIFAVQQAALDADRRGLSAWDLRSTAPIRADQGLTLARRLLQQRLDAEAVLPAATGP
jgi:phenylpropionate dioxygenase-like ring-hydroxylating dioxygenase large terminal subunit